MIDDLAWFMFGVAAAVTVTAIAAFIAARRAAGRWKW